MTSASLLELAGRIGKPTGPCRETDGEIANALSLYPHDGWRRGVAEASATAIWFNDRTGQSWSAPAYTASLDAAMTLVPTTVARKDGTAQTPFLRLERYSETEWRANIGFGNSMIGVNAKAATPALALVAASLRARAASEDRSNG